MLKIIRSLLLDCVNRIDAGNSNVTEKEQEEIISLLKKVTTKDKKLSKYQACEYLNISRATFDNYIREGKLPKGEKEAGFKELFWNESVLRKYLQNNK